MIDLEILYNKIGAPSLSPYIESVSLVDIASGKASTLSVTLCNADGRFTGQWRATKGDSISLSMPPAGSVSFAITRVIVQDRPRLVTWEAESRPAVSKAPKDRGAGSPPPSSGAIVRDKKSWDDGPIRGRRLKDIADRVCRECDLGLRYLAKDNPVIAHCARYNETGFHLLARLCRRFGLDVRASAGSVSIIGLQRSADASPPASMRFSTDKIISLLKVDDVSPSAVASSRLDPRSGKARSAQSGDGDGVVSFFDFDVEISSAVYDAALASSMTAELAVVPTPGVVAGCVLDITGAGLREVVEVRYTRTGDSEQMTLKTKAA